MTIPFGPQLIGQTEKTLNHLLDRALAGTGLTEREWVALRLAGQVGAADAASLARAVADRARFADAPAIVGALGERGLVAAGAPTDAAEALVADVQARVAALAGPVWVGLDPADVAAAERVLNTVLDRAREAAEAAAG